MLLGITVGLGVFLIGYTLIRQFAGIGFGEDAEKTMFDIIILTALGVFVYNRKLAADEKKERQDAERAEAAKQAEAAESVPDEHTAD
jgi:uncharacterized membrane protein